jgi:hypothetical protein
MQIPFEEIALPSYLDMLDKALHALYALSVRGYIVFILAGMMIYATSLGDGTAKGLIIGGIALYFLGPFVVTYMMNVAGLGPIDTEKAEVVWRGLFGIGDLDILALSLMIGDALVAVLLLAGAILYFTPSSKDLKNKGQSIITRSLVLSPVLVFFHFSSII